MPKSKSRKSAKTKKTATKAPGEKRGWKQERSVSQKSPNYVPNMRTSQNANWEKRS
jgi:hypothetical protein